MDLRTHSCILFTLASVHCPYAFLISLFFSFFTPFPLYDSLFRRRAAGINENNGQYCDSEREKMHGQWERHISFVWDARELKRRGCNSNSGDVSEPNSAETGNLNFFQFKSYFSVKRKKSDLQLPRQLHPHMQLMQKAHSRLSFFVRKSLSLTAGLSFCKFNPKNHVSSFLSTYFNPHSLPSTNFIPTHTAYQWLWWAKFDSSF